MASVDEIKRQMEEKLKEVEENQKKEMEMLMERQKAELGRLQGDFANMISSAEKGSEDQSQMAEKQTVEKPPKRQTSSRSGSFRIAESSRRRPTCDECGNELDEDLHCGRCMGRDVVHYSANHNVSDIFL